MRKNRELRDQQLAEAERLAQIEKRGSRGEFAAASYRARLEREKERAAENEAARQAVLNGKHTETCRGIAEQLAMLAARVVDFRSTTQPLLPPKVMRDWMTLFKSGLPLEPPGYDTPHVEELPEGEGEEAEAPAPAEADTTVNKAELDNYLATVADWDVLNLAAKALPEEGADGILVSDETLSPAPAEAGCAQTGRMVLDLIDTCVPPPPKPEAANLPSSLIKVAVLGRPFAGKSMQAQKLAEASGLLVIMPMQLVEVALSAMTTYDEMLAEAKAKDEEEAATAEPWRRVRSRLRHMRMASSCPPPMSGQGCRSGDAGGHRAGRGTRRPRRLRHRRRRSRVVRRRRP